MLAEYIDGGLEPRERAQVEEHLAECGDCYEAFTTVSLVNEDLARKSRPVTARESAGRRSSIFRVLGPLAAIAATILVAVFARAWFGDEARSERTMAEFVGTIGTSRFTAARLAAPFQYGQEPSPVRGPSASRVPEEARRVGLRLIELATKDRPGPAALRGRAIALLAEGHLDDAIDTLVGLTKDHPDSRAAFVDLSAAYIERWRRDGSNADAVRGLDAAEKSVALNPAFPPALFNYALAAEAVGYTNEAKSGWHRYLAVDGTSEWAAEARQHLQRLEQSASRGLDSAIYQTLNEQVIGPWAESVVSGATFDLASGRLRAQQAKASGADPAVPDFVIQAAESAQWTKARRLCLAEGALAMAASRAAFDSSQYKAARTGAAAAERFFGCAGVSTSASRLQQSWASFFEDNRTSAVESARQLASDFERTGQARAAARIHYMEGLLAVGNSRITAGIGHYQQAVELSARASDWEQVAATEALLAEAFELCGDREASWKHIGIALSHWDEIARPRLRYLVLSYAQAFAVDQGLLNAASIFARRIRDVTTGWAPAVIAVQAAADEGELLWKLGQAPEATIALTRARDSLHLIEDESVRAQYDAMIGWTEVKVHGESRPDALLAELDSVFQRIEKAGLKQSLAEAHLMRGRVFASRKESSRAVAEWRSGIDILETEAKGIAEDRLLMLRKSINWDLYAELIRALAADPKASLIVAERSRSSVLARKAFLTQATPGASAEAAVRNLPVDTIALVYASLPEELVVWRVRGSDVQVFVTPISRPDLMARVAAFASGTASAESRRDLAGILIPEIGRSPGSLLSILPDGPLHEMPFAALPNPSTGRPLAADFIPVIEPSLAHIAKRSPHTQSGLGQAVVVGFGGAQPALDLPVLPGIRGEVAAIARSYPSPTLLTGASATRETVLRRLGTASVIHLAGHILTDANHPEKTRFFVAESSGGDSLTASDIASLRMRAGTIVVLSACEGAKGEHMVGEGSLSLAYAFIAAGAAGVVASLTPVSDTAAIEISVPLHEKLARGHSLASALAETQRELMLNGRPQSTWANWISMGTNRTE